MRLTIAALTLACLCLPIAPALAQSSGKEFIQHGAVTLQHKGKVYRGHATMRVTPRNARAARALSASQIVSHPPGCPRRAFCGCGAALEVFGKHVRSLWLARNWFRFPRTSPAPGMVAVRRNHVFVIREVRGPGLVLAYDANSGGRKTRLHVRSLKGFVVVNPHARRFAGR
jgi:hypothetical protein